MKINLRLVWARDHAVSSGRPRGTLTRRRTGFPSYKPLCSALSRGATAQNGSPAFPRVRHTIVTFTPQLIISGVI